jgi:hypothetical protein
VAAEGWEFMDVIPRDGYIVRSSTKRSSADLRARPGVRWAGGMEPAMRVSPDLLPELRTKAAANEEIEVLVLVWAGESRKALAAELEAAGMTIVASPRYVYYQTLLVRVPALLLPNSRRKRPFSGSRRSRPAARNNSCTGVLQSGDPSVKTSGVTAFMARAR